MLRDTNLIPLSRQHHTTLALCVRMARAASSGSFQSIYWQNEMRNHFEPQLRTHFEIEEKVVFPIARDLPQMAGIADGLLAERVVLRDLLARAGKYQLGELDLLDWGSLLATHIRREESQLFEGCQRYCSGQQMQFMGREIVRLLGELEVSASACLLPPNV